MQVQQCICDIQVWEYACVHEEIVHGQDTVTKFYAHMRKDRDSLLQDLISSPEVSLLLLDIPERHHRLVLVSIFALSIHVLNGSGSCMYMCSMCRLMACI